MKSPRIEVYQILRQACKEELKDLIEVEHVFTIRIPEEEIKVKNAPIVRIDVIKNDPDDFASNKILTHDQIIQISVWDADSDKLDTISSILDELFDLKDWVLSRDFDIVEDEDFNEFYMLAKRYRKTKLKQN